MERPVERSVCEFEMGREEVELYARVGGGFEIRWRRWEMGVMVSHGSVHRASEVIARREMFRIQQRHEACHTGVLTLFGMGAPSRVTG